MEKKKTFNPIRIPLKEVAKSVYDRNLNYETGYETIVRELMLAEGLSNVSYEISVDSEHIIIKPVKK